MIWLSSTMFEYFMKINGMINHVSLCLASAYDIMPMTIMTISSPEPIAVEISINKQFSSA